MTYKFGFSNLFIRGSFSQEESGLTHQTSGLRPLNQLLRNPEIATLDSAIRAVVSGLMVQRCNKLKLRSGFDCVPGMDTDGEEQTVFSHLGPKWRIFLVTSMVFLRGWYIFSKALKTNSRKEFKYKCMFLIYAYSSFVEKKNCLIQEVHSWGENGYTKSMVEICKADESLNGFEPFFERYKLHFKVCLFEMVCFTFVT